MTIDQFELRLLLALILGSAIGFERQWRHKMAGIKTNALVAIGAALYMLIAEKITGDNTSISRIAGQIVTGVGFLGAGVIMKEGFTVAGLNTSGTIWCSGAIGTLCGMGYWYEPAIGAAGILLCHFLLRPLEVSIDKKRSFMDDMNYQLKIICSHEDGDRIRGQLIAFIKNTPNVKLSAIELKNDTDIKNVQLRLELKAQEREDDKIQELMKLIKSDAAVYSISYNVVDLSSSLSFSK